MENINSTGGRFQEPEARASNMYFLTSSLMSSGRKILR